MALNANISVDGFIAKGSHSSVKLGRDLDTFETMALKEFHLDHAGNEALFAAELQVFQKLGNHKNLPKFFGYIFKMFEKRAYIVLEFLPFPTLAHFLATSGPMPESHALYVLYQLLDVAHFMMEQGLVHRDLKADNIIINPDTLVIKVIDFGLTSEIKSEGHRVSTHLGTPLYMAPEILRQVSRFEVVRADVWSIGMIFLEMLRGTQPFGHLKHREELVLAQQCVFISGYSPAVTAMLHGLLTFEPSHRLTLSRAFSLIVEYYDNKRANNAAEGIASYSPQPSPLVTRRSSASTTAATKASPHSSPRTGSRPTSPLVGRRIRAYSHSRTKSWEGPVSPTLARRSMPNVDPIKQ